MSNVIKANSVRYNNTDKITIDNHFKLDQKIESDHGNIPKVSQPQDGEFVEGISAVLVEELPSEDMTKKAEKIIDEANEKAKSIIDNANNEAERIKNETAQAAQKKGYEEGIAKANKEAAKLKADYEEKSRRLQQEYDEMMLSMEPQMLELVAGLIEKITGILVKDNEEVIRYLVYKSLKNMDKSDSYTIRVSREDYSQAVADKDVFAEAVGSGASLNIVEDTNLTKNQCLIETDYKVINCSLDTQMNNLITDLKLLGGI